MPRARIPTPHPSSANEPSSRWERALAQLRVLTPAHLDRLVSRWATRLGLHSVRRLEPGGAALYQGTVTLPALTLPVRLQIHQRQSRLQVHHVEAFAGQLVRAGVPAGLLVTTGEITPEARWAAERYPLPRLRLYSGPEWAAELARRHLGVQRRSLWEWVLDCQVRLRRPTPPASRSARRFP